MRDTGPMALGHTVEHMPFRDGTAHIQLQPIFDVWELSPVMLDLPIFQAKISENLDF